MEKVFQTILRWLNLDDEFVVDSNNLVTKVLPRGMFSIITERVRSNIALNDSIIKINQDEIVLDRREYVDGYWGKCRLTVINSSENVKMEYKFLGYEALVNGTIVLVDSLKTMSELGD